MKSCILCGPYIRTVVLACAFCLLPGVQAADWQFTTGLFSGLSRYQGSESRENYQSAGVSLQGDFLDSAGFALGYAYGELAGSDGEADISEHAWYADGYANHYSDLLGGRLRFQGGYIAVEDTASLRTVINMPGGGGMGGGPQPVVTTTRTRDRVKVLSPKLAFLNFRKTFYADLGYAYSRYRFEDVSREDLDVDQWTPTFGFAWNERYDWLQSRLYLLRLSDGADTAGVTSTRALELKWSRWLKPPGRYNIDSYTLGVLVGESLFAVDPDANIVYSFSHQRTGALTLQVNWNLSEQFSISSYLAHVRYHDLERDDDYTGNDIYFHFNKQW